VLDITWRVLGMISCADYMAVFSFFQNTFQIGGGWGKNVERAYSYTGQIGKLCEF